MLRIERLEAIAHRDDSETALADTMAYAAAGEEAWQQWLREYRQGEALMVRVELTVELSHGPPLQITNTGVWIEVDAQPPKVEHQLAELMFKDFDTIEDELAKRGEPIDSAELGDMYIHIELGDDIRRALHDVDRHGDGRRSPPDFEIRLSDQHHGLRS